MGKNWEEIMRKKCGHCSGSGKQMGKGMLIEKCAICCNGWIVEGEEEKDFKASIDKRSKEYKKAISEIKKSRDGMTDAEAAKLFDDALGKVGNSTKN